MLVIPIFVPHAGCPNDCCFCNQKIISGHESVPNKQDVLNTILFYQEVAHRYTEVQLAFYGGSFTAIDVPLQEMFLKTVQPFLRANGGFIDKIRLSTRPDCIDEKVIERLLKYNASIVELGAQSMDDRVLEMSQRGHDSNATRRASKLLKENSITLGIQTMTGLPGASRESDIYTSKCVAEMKPDFVRIYPTIVVKNTTLCDWFSEGKYVSPTLGETVDLCAELYCFYKSHNIDVVRMGLQSSDNISDGGDIEGGPYHSAFGQLVHSKIALNKIEKELAKLGIADFEKQTLAIYVPRGRTSDYVGQKKQNTEHLMSKYGFKRVKIIEDITLCDDDGIKLSVL